MSDHELDRLDIGMDGYMEESEYGDWCSYGDAIEIIEKLSKENADLRARLKAEVTP